MVLQNTSLKNLNTFGIDVKAKYFSRFDTIEELSTIFREHSGIEFLILGGGSNLLLTQDFDGLVLRNEIIGKSIVEESENTVLVKIGAGEN